MELLVPKRYPFVRGFAMVGLLLLTVGVVSAVLEWQEQQDDQLWAEEHAPHPWPWPGQDRWPRSDWRFDFGPVFAKTVDLPVEPPAQVPMETWTVGDTTLVLDCRVVQVRKAVGTTTDGRR